jgi:hypothetical protein
VNVVEYFEQSLIHTAFLYVTWLTRLKFRSHSDSMKIAFSSRRYSFMNISKVSDALTGIYASITIAKTLMILNTVWEHNIATLVYNVQCISILRFTCNFRVVLLILGLRVLRNCCFVCVCVCVCVLVHLNARLDHNIPKI